jgi:hypothetical protein
VDAGHGRGHPGQGGVVHDGTLCEIGVELHGGPE